MLTLITGEPGNGKTACALSMILEELARQPRPLFVWGINELKIEHTPCPPLEKWTRSEKVPEDPSLSRAVFDFPSGSLVVIDECQDVYRCRAASSKVPDHVSALERHRHQGLDFYLITQKPMQIDANVRALIGRHIHIKSDWSGRKLYEWSEVKNPASRIDRTLATTRKYKLPKKVFDLYKSATMHMMPNRRIPIAVWILIGVIVAIVIMSYWLVARWKDKIEGPKTETTVAGQVAERPTKEGAQPLGAAQVEIKQIAMWIESYIHVAVGPRVITSSWTIATEDGKRIKLAGYACKGDGYDAVCNYQGREVRYQRSPVQRVVARVENPK